MQNGNVIKKTWIILDTCSIDSVTKNLDYVEDVNNCTKNKELTILTNVGPQLFYQKGTLMFLSLYLHAKEKYLATILLLKDVNNITGVRANMDTSI